MDLYDQDGEYWTDAEYEAYEDQKEWMRLNKTPTPALDWLRQGIQEAKVPSFTPEEKSDFRLWDHELAQPDYYAYFLEEVTR